MFQAVLTWRRNDNRVQLLPHLKGVEVLPGCIVFTDVDGNRIGIRADRLDEWVFRATPPDPPTTTLVKEGTHVAG